MVVASGQMPYNYGFPLEIRQNMTRPFIGPSGDVIEAGMHTLVAELRKWSNISNQLEFTYHDIYTHPDVAASGFDPKPSGETLVGLVGNARGYLAVDNIEKMRLQLDTFLFDAMSDDSNYGQQDFKETWLKTTYPDSPSGDLRLIDGGFFFSLVGRNWFRPAAEHIENGDYIDNDPHWLGGSGIIMDIDVGEVMFNPFPFPGEGNFFTASSRDMQFAFSPVIPLVQTTAGNIPSVLASRYESDTANGTFKSTTNFQALESGYCQIDGYALIAETTMELVKGNDFNFEGTVASTNDYTGHIQGLRQVALRENDPSARCYRFPTAQPTGLYRFLTHNRFADVPDTVIPSGFVSLFPQGRVIKADSGDLLLANRIDGQQLVPRVGGGVNAFELETGSAQGVHVFDDAIWTTGPGNSGIQIPPTNDYISRGLHVLSPFTGRSVWWRPAQLDAIATTGPVADGWKPTFGTENEGPQPGPWAYHLGLMDIGGQFVRVSRVFREEFDNNGTTTDDTDDFFERDIYFQRYNKTTLSRSSETLATATMNGEDAASMGFTRINGAVYDGTSIYVWEEFATIDRYDSSFNHTGTFRGSPGNAARRHWDGSQLLYTLYGNVQSGDPLLSIAGGSTSGIGVWSISAEPSAADEEIGDFSHDSAKPFQCEWFIQNNPSATDCRWHSIFEVTGASHVRNGIWGLFQAENDIWLFRIREEASRWVAVEGIELDDFVQDVEFGNFYDQKDYPWEAILHDID